ncbi:MAG: glycosyltransferase family 39 protein [Candidatus Shapirobacteria bacterium]|nr:glycosyltransferase family 39 protein [Candidatus Shapirobacteria bacterium]
MKNQNLFFKLTLIAILLFSFFLYLYKNTEFPPSLFSDEVDINYQAFIFNNRNTDYFGNKFPIHFHSFVDWQPSFFIYSVALIQKIVGHSDVSIRISSAIFGTLTILFFCLIIKELINNSVWSIIGGFLLSITPWLFHFSRVGFAATNMLFLTLSGIYFWIKFIKTNKNKNLYLSLICFSLLTYSYSTAKLHLVFIFLSIFIIWFKTIIKIPIKTKFIAIFLIILISLPIIVDTIKGRAGYRFSYINIFTDPTVSKTVDYLRYEDSIMVFGQQIGLKPMLISKINHNKISQWSETFIKNYFSAFSTEFLFLKGDCNLRQGVQTAGNLLYLDLFFIIIGISSIFVKKTPNHKFYLFFLFSLIFAPIPFSITRDSPSPHATRLILMLPFLSLFSILGIKQIFKITKSKIFISLILFIYLLCFGRFLHQYYFHYPNNSARDWHFGMKEAVLTAINSDYQQKYFANYPESFTPFFLNYSEYLPSDKNISPTESFTSIDTSSFSGIKTESNYYLGHINWSNLFKDLPQNSLFVVPKQDLIIINNSLNDYNQNNSNKINFIEVSKINQKYREQQEFYLITFKNEK